MAQFKALEVLELTPDAFSQNIGGEAVVKTANLQNFLKQSHLLFIKSCLYKDDEEQALKEYIIVFKPNGVTAGDVALTGESPDKCVYQNWHGKVEKGATAWQTSLQPCGEEVEHDRELYKTYRSTCFKWER